jgi:hypothetical protein
VVTPRLDTANKKQMEMKNMREALFDEPPSQHKKMGRAALASLQSIGSTTSLGQDAILKTDRSIGPLQHVNIDLKEVKRPQLRWEKLSKYRSNKVK